MTRSFSEGSGLIEAEPSDFVMMGWGLYKMQKVQQVFPDPGGPSASVPV